MLNVTVETFARDVEQASLDHPVVVDFWGHRCGPCKALAPVLERLEPEYGGRLALVKVNIQEEINQALPQRLGFLNIPHLIAFVDGQPVRRLTGNKPESQLRAFFEEVLAVPRASAALQQKGVQTLEKGDLAGGLSTLRQALALEPRNDDVRLALIEALERSAASAEVSPIQEIGDLLEGCSEETRRGSSRARYESLRLRWRCMQELPSMPAAAELRGRIAADPANLSQRIQLMRRCIAERKLEEAADQLLECLQVTATQARSFIEADRQLRLVLMLSGTALDAQRGRHKAIAQRVYAVDADG